MNFLYFGAGLLDEGLALQRAHAEACDGRRRGEDRGAAGLHYYYYSYYYYYYYYY